MIIEMELTTMTMTIATTTNECDVVVVAAAVWRKKKKKKKWSGATGWSAEWSHWLVFHSFRRIQLRLLLDGYLSFPMAKANADQLL